VTCGAFLAALAVLLYWDQGPGSAQHLKEAGIQSLYVPSTETPAWKTAGLEAMPFDPNGSVKLEVPGVQYRMDVASATTAPWIDANGWRIRRNQKATYYYDVPKGKSALAAAEAFVYRAEAAIHADPADVEEFGRMQAFLRHIDGTVLQPLANIGVVDDGSEQTGEVLNLLARRNLLFRIVRKPDPGLDLNVTIGSQEFPKRAAADPYAFAVLVRQKLTDRKRLVRIYGSDVVIAAMDGDGMRARVHLLNYSGRKVEGLRVQIRGAYSRGAVAVFGIERATLSDYAVSGDSTEFTIPEMNAYAVADLAK
jgi:hypothetical protein